jgi:FdhD protein
MVSPILKKVKLTRLNGGSAIVAENIIKETPLTIRIDGKHYNNVMLLAARLKEFVVGYLFGQGIIHQAADIKSLTIKNNTADVSLVKRSAKSPFPSVIDSPLKVSKEDVFNCVNAILKSPVFAETEAVHSAGLFLHGKETVCIAEDIGRHHALDKVIGAALLQDIPLNETLAASTGRMTLEMVTKICRAGIPIVASKAAVTDQGLALAKKCGLTVIGFVRDTGTRMHTDMDVRIIKEAGMKIYAGADRIRCE